MISLNIFFTYSKNSTFDNLFVQVLLIICFKTLYVRIDSDKILISLEVVTSKILESLALKHPTLALDTFSYIHLFLYICIAKSTALVLSAEHRNVEGP